jgi:hypothetical protein
VVLENPKEQAQSPFEKLFDKEVEKFRIKVPESQKRNFGRGKLQLLKGVFGEAIVMKLVFKNSIGKILYDGSLSGKMSKSKKVAEKANKNQYKVALMSTNPADKKLSLQYCLINFLRNDDLESFDPIFKKAVKELQEAVSK